MKNYKVCTFPEVYKEINLNFKDYTEYPSKEQLFNGLPMNETFIYVSSTYLNGLINYTNINKAFLNFKYRHNNEDLVDDIIKRTINQIEEMPNKEWYHSKLSKFENDVFIIAAIEDSWIIFEYDLDVSECIISRLSKQDYTYEQIEEYVISIMYNDVLLYNPDVTQYIELPHPEGWVKF